MTSSSLLLCALAACLPLAAQAFAGQLAQGANASVGGVMKNTMCATQHRVSPSRYFTIATAKAACSVNPSCAGVYDAMCDSRGPFYLCGKNGTSVSSGMNGKCHSDSNCATGKQYCTGGKCTSYLKVGATCGGGRGGIRTHCAPGTQCRGAALAYDGPGKCTGTAVSHHVTHPHNSTCKDTPGFTDKWGSCATYKAKNWCTMGGSAGKGWKSSWGALDTKVATACCACGGGSTGAGALVVAVGHGQTCRTVVNGKVTLTKPCKAPYVCRSNQGMYNPSMQTSACASQNDRLPPMAPPQRQQVVYGRRRAQASAGVFTSSPNSCVYVAGPKHKPRPMYTSPPVRYDGPIMMDGPMVRGH